MAGDRIRYLSSNMATAVNSMRRTPKVAEIPPFTFVGELEAGNSGIWFPPSTYELTGISVSCNEAGTESAVLSLMKEEPLTFDVVEIKRMTMPVERKKVVYSLKDNEGVGAIVTPYDKIFITSWVDSYHTGIVVQIVGYHLT